MTTETKLKSQCTPDIIKRMVELAIDAGSNFELSTFDGHGDIVIYQYNKACPLSLIIDNPVFSPLLIHRAVEGFNKINLEKDMSLIEIDFEEKEINFYDKGYFKKGFRWENYQPQSLTACECAMLHCLLDIFEEEGNE